MYLGGWEGGGVGGKRLNGQPDRKISVFTPSLKEVNKKSPSYD